MTEGEIFKNIRKAMDMDQISFGALFGKGSSWTTKLENGYNECFRQFLEIANTLLKNYNVSAHYLITGDGPIFREDQSSNMDAFALHGGVPAVPLPITTTEAFMFNAASMFREKFEINEKTREGLNLLLVDTATNELVRLHKELDMLEIDLQHSTSGNITPSSDHLPKIQSQKIAVQAKIAKVKEELMLLLFGGSIDA